MKRIPNLAALLGVVILAQMPAWAVYPPSTSMADTEQPLTSTTADNGAAAVARFSIVTDRLQEKENKLDEVIKNLQRDEETLRQTPTQSAKPSMVPNQKNFGSEKGNQ